MPEPTIDFDPAAHPRKLNLGCGYDHLEGYLNVDLHAYHEPDLVADVRWLDPLPDGDYDEVLAQDVLEHLPRTQTVEVLAEWNRVLREGGALRIRVPGLDLVTRHWDLQNDPPETQMLVMHLLYGTQAYDGDFHLTSFTRVLIEHYFTQCGFELRSIETVDEWMYDAVGEKLRPLTADDGLEFIRDLDEFLDAAYRTILERDPDPEGRAYYMEKLRAGDLSRYLVLEVLKDARSKELGEGARG